MDRKLWTDGGYYISNGAALCSKHHLDAERGLITPMQCFFSGLLENAVGLPFVTADSRRPTCGAAVLALKTQWKVRFPAGRETVPPYDLPKLSSTTTVSVCVSVLAEV